MAISLVGSGVEASAINGGNVTLTLPVGMAEGDVVYVFAAWSSNSLGGGTTSSSGWTQVGSTVDSGTLRTTLWRKTMGAVPDTSFVAVGTTASTDACAALGYALRGVDLTTPEDAAPTTANGSSTNPDAASITTVTNGAYGLAFAGSQVIDGSISPPSGWGNQVDISANDDQNLTVAGATLLHGVAGAVNPASWTTWSSGVWVAWNVAARPSVLGIVASPGSYTLTAAAASLEYGFEIVASPGSYTLTAANVDIQTGFVGLFIVAAAAAFQLTPADASLEIGRKVVASTGTFTLTGSAALLEYGRMLTAQGGAFTFAASDATLSKSVVQASAATLTVFGTWTLEVDPLTPLPLKVTSQIAAMPTRAGFPTVPLKVLASTSIPLRVR
jgi:hypothetical protein